VTWGHELDHHLPKKFILRLIGRMRLGQNESKAYRNAIDIPGDHQHHEANAEKVGVLVAFAAFLRHRMLFAPFRFLAAIPNQVKDPIFGSRKALDRLIGQPTHQNVDTPIGRFQQPAESPFCDQRRRPSRLLFELFRTRIDRLHEDQPTQQQTMTAFPYPGHPTKDDLDKRWQIRQLEHRIMACWV